MSDSLQVSSSCCLLGCLAVTSSLSLAAGHYNPTYMSDLYIWGAKNMQHASAITTVRCPSAQACSKQPTHTHTMHSLQGAPSSNFNVRVDIHHALSMHASRKGHPPYLLMYIYTYLLIFCITANLTDAYKYAFVRLARPGGIT